MSGIKLKISSRIVLSLILTPIVWQNSAPTLAAECQREVVGEVREGEVPIKREGNNILARVGDQICEGDFLTPQNPAKIYCKRDGSVRPIQPGDPYGVYDICPKPQQIDLGPEDSDNRKMPRILSPRNTAILDPNLRLRWQTLEGETSYNIRLEDLNGLVWEATVSSTDTTYCNQPMTRGDDYIEIVYCGEPLTRGRGYNLQVIAGDSKATDEDRFTVLKEDDAAKIKQQNENKNLADFNDFISLLPSYQKYELRAEAIAILERLVNDAIESEVARIYSELAGLYYDVDLSDRAIEYSQKAAEQAAATNNFIMAAFNRYRLGEIYLVQGEEESAIEELTAAEALYEQGGNPELAAEVRRRLEQLLDQ